MLAQKRAAGRPGRHPTAGAFRNRGRPALASASWASWRCDAPCADALNAESSFATLSTAAQVQPLALSRRQHPSVWARGAGPEMRVSRLLGGVAAAALVASVLLAHSAAAAGANPTFKIANGRFERDGKPFRIMAGSIHYSRVVPELWADRLQRLRAMGLNAVEVRSLVAIATRDSQGKLREQSSARKPHACAHEPSLEPASVRRCTSFGTGTRRSPARQTSRRLRASLPSSCNWPRRPGWW